MKIECWVVGKTDADYLKTGLSVYEKRLIHYTSFDWIVLPEIKNAGALDKEVLKQKEGEAAFQKLNKEDFLVLLDEKGKTFTSLTFAKFIEAKQSLGGLKKMIFFIGGAYGFSDAVRQRADFQLSLSELTFSHQLIRLIFLEQLYRAFTIIRGEKYHNE